jgi:hypothetical protein
MRYSIGFRIEEGRPRVGPPGKYYSAEKRGCKRAVAATSRATTDLAKEIPCARTIKLCLIEKAALATRKPFSIF